MVVDLHLDRPQLGAGDVQAHEHLPLRLFALLTVPFFRAIPRASADGGDQRRGDRPARRARQRNPDEAAEGSEVGRRAFASTRSANPAGGSTRRSASRSSSCMGHHFDELLLERLERSLQLALDRCHGTIEHARDFLRRQILLIPEDDGHARRRRELAHERAHRPAAQPAGVEIGAAGSGTASSRRKLNRRRRL